MTWIPQLPPSPHLHIFLPEPWLHSVLHSEFIHDQCMNQRSLFMSSSRPHSPNHRRRDLSPHSRWLRDKAKATANKQLQRDRQRLDPMPTIPPATPLTLNIHSRTQQLGDDDAVARAQHARRMMELEAKLDDRRQKMQRFQQRLEENSRLRQQELMAEQQKQNEIDALQAEFEAWVRRMSDGDDAMADKHAV